MCLWVSTQYFYLFVYCQFVFILLHISVSITLFFSLSRSFLSLYLDIGPFCLSISIFFLCTFLFLSILISALSKHIVLNSSMASSTECVSGIVNNISISVNLYFCLFFCVLFSLSILIWAACLYKHIVLNSSMASSTECVSEYTVQNICPTFEIYLIFTVFAFKASFIS